VHQDLYTALWLKTNVFATQEQHAVYINAVDNAVKNAHNMAAKLHSAAVGAGADDEGPGDRSVRGFIDPTLLRAVEVLLAELTQGRVAPPASSAAADDVESGESEVVAEQQCLRLLRAWGLRRHLAWSRPAEHGAGGQRFLLWAASRVAVGGGGVPAVSILESVYID
jgi:hypothetical protein